MAAATGFVRQHWFLLALAVVLVGGVAIGPLAAESANAFPRRTLVAAILFVTALPVDLGRTASTRAAVIAVLLAVFVSTVAAPVVGFGLSQLLPPAIGVGLFAIAASPCTMASAAVWTRRGGGNDAVALAVTLVTSLACFVVMPGWAWLLLGEEIAVPAGSLTTTLLVCVAAPVAAAQLARRLRPLARWATRHKTPLTVAGQVGILGVVLLGAIRAGADLRTLGEPLGAGVWIAVPTLAAVAHGCLFLGAGSLARAAGLPRAEAVAVAVAGSQKTLAVGVGIAGDFGPLALFPMVAYHVAQLVIDTLLVPRAETGS